MWHPIMLISTVGWQSQKKAKKGEKKTLVERKMDSSLEKDYKKQKKQNKND